MAEWKKINIKECAHREKKRILKRRSERHHKHTEGRVEKGVPGEECGATKA